MTARALFLSVLACSLCASIAAAEPLAIDLWPGKVPGDVGITGEEKFIQLMKDGKPLEVGGKPTKWLTNVSKPQLVVYRAAKESNTGVCMLICPGGGYHNLGWDVEGEEVAAWLNSIGITGVILKYRCPRRPGDVKGEPPLGPLIDAQRAVCFVRGKAKDWELDPAKIGMVGFSAGGHLVGAAATNFDQRKYDAIDAVDAISCRPDFAVMLYSGYFKPKDKNELSPTIRLAPGGAGAGAGAGVAPPMFLVHASDDTVSDVDCSVTMYLAMKHAGVPIEMHLYANGGHGFAVRKVGLPCETWTERCVEWLRTQGMLKKEK
ncbi:MAG TPA: alpha/beta hydrolase [Planctomycetota bacterium]|nr:alpha/beta hydrolase [Planctomycetota bacterium]